MTSNTFNISTKLFDAALVGELEKAMPYSKIPSSVKKDIKLCLCYGNPYELASSHPLLLRRFYRYSHQFTPQRFSLLRSLLALAAINEWSKKRIKPIMQQLGLDKVKSKKLSPKQEKALTKALVTGLSKQEMHYLNHLNYAMSFDALRQAYSSETTMILVVKPQAWHSPVGPSHLRKQQKTLHILRQGLAPQPHWEALALPQLRLLQRACIRLPMGQRISVRPGKLQKRWIIALRETLKITERLNLPNYLLPPGRGSSAFLGPQTYSGSGGIRPMVALGQLKRFIIEVQTKVAFQQINASALK
jgi:hypothetical protein